jgi:ABC-type amino acid transport system permease subunit
MLGSVQQAVRDPQWLGPVAEGYGFVACIFFMICMMLSTMSKSIERELDPSFAGEVGRTLEP